MSNCAVPPRAAVRRARPRRVSSAPTKAVSSPVEGLGLVWFALMDTTLKFSPESFLTHLIESSRPYRHRGTPYIKSRRLRALFGWGKPLRRCMIQEF